MTETSPRSYRFDGFRLNTGSRTLIGGDGAAIPLTGKAFDVLLCLVEQAPRMVGKDELLARVWDGRVVEENNLTQAISTLRKALGSSAGDHRYILTEARRGYRFVAEVQPEHAAPTIPGPTPGAAVRVPIASRRSAMLAAAVLMAFVLVLVAVRDRGDPERSGSEAADTPPALAVLPFRALPGTPRDELLELGLADTLITRLSRSSALRVRSLASSQRISAMRLDAPAAGRRLNAGYVVEGSTQRLGDRVRVNVRLLQVDSGQALWADTFDVRPQEVFTLHDRIATAVASILAVRLDAMPTPGRSPCDGSDAQAYRASLSGQYLMSRPDPVRLPKALAAFRRAIELDPACARAYAGMVYAYHGQVITGDRAPHQMFPLAKAAAEQALRIDPESAEAHTAKGFSQFWYDWDWAGAETSFKRAIALNPSLAWAHFGYAHLLVNTGRFEEGLAHARQARELDPLSPLISTLEAGFLGAAHRPVQAGDRLALALELEPEFWIALLVRGGMALDRGDYHAAVADLERAVDQSKGNTQVVAMLGTAYAASGNRAGAERALRTLQTRAAGGYYVPATSLAAVHLALGDVDQALDLLDRAYAERDMRLAFLGIDARWNGLRTHPRFRALARKIALEATWAYGRF